jgi:SAM-dependent methyltransferase
VSVADFTTGTFSASPERVERLTETVLHWVRSDTALRVLDLGCGTGAQLASLAEAMPGATLVGIDLSPGNVAAATADAAARGRANSMRFVAGNFLEQDLGSFDLIVSDSTLHLITCSTEQLLERLRSVLAPGGLLVFTMPDGCRFNRLLWTVRRLCRALRSPVLDRLILTAGRRLHKSSVSEAMLRERVAYMYSLPVRCLGMDFRRDLIRFGFVLIEEGPCRHASLGQPKHRLCVARREEPVKKSNQGDSV